MRRTSDGASGLGLVVGRATVFASKAHQDDFPKVRNGGEHHACHSLRSASTGVSEAGDLTREVQWRGMQAHLFPASHAERFDLL